MTIESPALSLGEFEAVGELALGLLLMIGGPIIARLRIWHVPRYSWQPFGPAFRLNRLGRFIAIVEFELVGICLLLVGLAVLFPTSPLSLIPILVYVALPALAWLILVPTLVLHMLNLLLDMDS